MITKEQLLFEICKADEQSHGTATIIANPEAIRDAVWNLLHPKPRKPIVGILACDSPPFPEIPCIELEPCRERLGPTAGVDRSVVSKIMITATSKDDITKDIDAIMRLIADSAVEVSDG